MTEEKKDDEATDKVNAPEPQKEESSPNKENLEDSKDKVKSEPEEIAGDYLEEGKSEEIDYKTRYGDSTREYRTLQQEHRALKEKSGTYIQAVETLERLARLNPRIAAEIEAAQGLSGQSTSTLVEQQVEKALAPFKEVTQGIQNKERLSKVKVLTKFEQKNPDLFPAKATVEQKKEIRQRIGKVANALVETGMPFSKAVERAYLTINPKAAIQKGKDKAYLEGLSEERAGFASQTSTQGRKSKKTGYSKRELEIAEKMGNKYKEAMLKDKS
jgi:hypothetical protein